MKENVFSEKREDFSLVDEPWVILLSKDGKTAKRSLKEAFLEAHSFIDVGGELRLQDAAILRLLTALSVKILYTYDEHGQEKPLLSRKEADRRFTAVWKAGRFCERAVADYFAKWHDRFYLFDRQYPFYQIPLEGMPTQKDKRLHEETPILDCGACMTWLPIPNVNARVQRTENRPYAPYKDISEDRIWTMDYDEAARWLVFYITYADCTAGQNRRAMCGELKGRSLKAGFTLPAHGARVTPVGNSLFETIMLNSCLYYIGNRLYDSCMPAWERDSFDRSVRFDAVMPYDLPQIYTSQSRRISLVREDGKVIGMFAAAGEAYMDDHIWKEPTFMIRNEKDKNDDEKINRRVIHCENSTDAWKEIEYITGSPAYKNKDMNDGAAIVRWVALLANNEEIIPEGRVIPFRVTDIAYKQMACGIRAMIEDSVVVGRRFLVNSRMQRNACEEIERTKEITIAVYSFGADCSRCMNLSKKDDDKKGKKKDPVGLMLQRRYTDEIGQVFRGFIAGRVSLNDLRKAEYDIAVRLVEEYVEENMWSLLKGRGGEEGMNLGEAYDIFIGRIIKHKPEDD